MQERISIVGGHLLVDPDGPYVLVSNDEARNVRLARWTKRIEDDLRRHAASVENAASIPNS
jgi:hypothetical protein